MTYPTLKEIFDSISSDLKEAFDISTENDLKRVLTQIAATDAGFLKLLYIALVDVRKNIYPDTADSEENGGTLERAGRIKLGREPIKATQGVYTINITGQIGGTLSEGDQLKSGANSLHPGELFEITEDVTLTGTSGTVEIQSVLAGLDYELNQGDELFLVKPTANINNLATINTVTTSPTDAETIEEYREQVLKAYRLEPQGGANSDYVYWSQDVTGVRTVYPYTTEGDSGSATIYVEALESYSIDSHGSAPADMILELWDKDNFTGVFEQDPDTSKTIYERGRRQLGLTDITLLSVTPKAINITITGLQDTSASVQSSIQDALTEYLYYIRPFIAGVDDVNNKRDTINISGLISTITNVVTAGNTFDAITVSGDVTSLPFTFENGDIPYLGTITYN